MELRERIAARPAGRRGAPRRRLRRGRATASTRELIADLGPQLASADVETAALRERVRAQVRGAAGERARPVRRRPRAAGRRDHRRHARPRARSRSCWPTTRSRRSWSTARATSGSSAAAACTRRPCASRDEAHLRRIITKIAGQVGRRVDESSPMLDARLPDGSRVNAVLPPLSLSGSLLTIRKFGARAVLASRTWSGSGP